MKKATISRPIALLVTVALILSVMAMMPVSLGGHSSPLLLHAVATGGGTSLTDSENAGGTGDVDYPILEVVVPLGLIGDGSDALDFTLNPLQIGDVVDGNQITTEPFPIINRTLAPVLVTLDVEVKGGAGAATAPVFVNSSANIKLDDTNPGSKNVFFGLLGAKTLSTPPSFLDNLGAEFTFDAPGTTNDAFNALVPEGAGASAKGSISFALDKATATAYAAGNKGVSAFQFYAQLDTYAGWQGGDIEVEGVYTFTALRGETYDKTEMTADGLNMVKGTGGGGGGTPVGFGTLPTVAGMTTSYNAGTRTLTVTVAASGTNAAYVIPFSGGGNTVTATQASNDSAIPSDRGAWDGSAGELTITQSRVTAMRGWTAGTDWIIDLKVDSGDTYKVRFVR